MSIANIQGTPLDLECPCFFLKVATLLKQKVRTAKNGDLMNKHHKTFLSTVLVLTLLATQAFACSWAAFFNGNAAVVARTVDWYSSDNAVVKGYGRGRLVKAADTPNALEYTSKYASLQIHSFESQVVVDAMNEKGLHGAILYLDETLFPESRPNNARDVDPNQFVPYVVSSFATVQELVDALEDIHFIPAHLNIPGADGKPIEFVENKWPGHFAFADATGDKVLIEFIKGEVVVYHGKEYDALTNDPRYELMEAAKSIGYTANGTIQSPDRLFRAKDYLRDMYERDVKTPARALLAMRGMLATMFAGTEAINRKENELYPTIWGALADQKAGRYYFSRVYSWCTEIYDFTMFDPAKPETVTLERQGCPVEDIDTEGVI